MKQLLKRFDLIKYLEENSIKYWEEGDNVTDGWINVRCIFDCGDNKNHLGINLEHKGANCWICGGHTLVEYIMKLEQINFYVARNRIEQYQDRLLRPQRKRERKQRQFDSLLPKNFEPIIKGKEPEVIKRYFKKRKFSLDICQQYGLGFVSKGEYQLRLIAPVYLDNILVSFQAADSTGKAKIPYLDCPPDRAIIQNKHTLYGIDDIDEQVILVEGITDKWRMGKDAVALFTKNYTVEQLILLSQKVKGKKVKIVLDAEAITTATKLAIELNALSVFSRVLLIDIEKGDPAELNDSDIYDILNM